MIDFMLCVSHHYLKKYGILLGRDGWRILNTLELLPMHILFIHSFIKCILNASYVLGAKLVINIGLSKVLPL